ncbi:MAG: hypothetical protein JWP52_846, partial [Rhizobacter sp.]|nr:hypothetical protein [Rhizobacter sp.]
MDDRYVPPRWLSQGAEAFAAQCGSRQVDVLVIGSGYGGAVAACRFSAMQRDGKPLEVVVLERGDEFVPGAFPDRFSQLLPHLRADRWTDDKKATAGAPDVSESQSGLDQALFDFKLGPQVSALVGNGLGGGSLINAGVVERPQPGLFTLGEWPEAVRRQAQDDPAGFWKHFADAEAMLGANAHPLTPKTAALFDDTGALENKVGAAQVKKVRPRIAVTLAATNNAQGVQQPPCVKCGNCVTGCNHWAKNTLPMNYLAQARRQGAQLYTGATVIAVRPESELPDAAFIVSFRLTHDQRDRHRSDARFEVRARHVVLAAGTYGTAQILHQSLKAPGGRALAHLSADAARPGWLGRGFSCNGDSISAAYDQAGRTAPVHGTGADPTHQQGHPGQAGPTITGMLDLRSQTSPGEGFVIQDAAIPFSLERLYQEALTTFGGVHRMTDWNLRGLADGAVDPLVVDKKRVERSQSFLIVGHDDAGWSLGFRETSSRIGDGPNAEHLSSVGVSRRDATVFAKRQDDVDALVALLTKGRTGGTFVPNPLWRPAPVALTDALRSSQVTTEADPLGAQRLLTVHPLGGCRMADSGAKGVVNHLGQVFFNASDDQVFKNLVVMDGSVMPRSLGINPLLTISALAERACGALATAWTLDAQAAPVRVALPTQPPVVPSDVWEPKPTQVVFNELMDGPLALEVNKDAGPEPLTEQQRDELFDARGQLRVSFAIDDLHALATSPAHGVKGAKVQLTLFWKGGPTPTPTAASHTPGHPEIGLVSTNPGHPHRRLPADKTRARIVLPPVDLSLLNLLPSEANQRIWRSLRHWWNTRGKAFLHDEVTWLLRAPASWLVRLLLSTESPVWRERWRSLLDWGAKALPSFKMLGLVRSMAAIASHHGEARVMGYQLGELDPADTPFNDPVTVLAAKRFHYGQTPGYMQRPSQGVVDPDVPASVPSTPWRALVDLRVLMVSRTEGSRPVTEADWPSDQWPANLDRALYKIVAHGVWTLDLERLIDRHIPQFASYGSLPDAWLDLASFAAFAARCTGQAYFWSFRLPQYPKQVPKPGLPDLGPLPGQVLDATGTRYVDDGGKGVVWERHWLKFQMPRAKAGERMPKTPPRAVLTRFFPVAGAPARQHPVVLMHGFVTSGYQYASPRMNTNAVGWLTQQGWDVWVLDLRTSIALPSSHDAWDFDVVAREDVPLAFARVLAETQRSQLHVVAHCMGSAVFNMAVLTGVLKRNGIDMVRSAVQTQVSMDVVSTPPNRLKASGLRFFEDLMQVDELTVVADQRALRDDGSGTPLVTLADRFLMTWPTADSEVAGQLDNGLFKARQEDVAIVNRINAMYGRNFSRENLAPGVVDHLQEVFRHANVATFRHVLEFHRAGRVVSAKGLDEYVTNKAVRKHYGFPVSFMHGQAAAVFGQASTRRARLRLARAHPNVVHERTVLHAPRHPAKDGQRHGDLKHPRWGHFDIWLSDRSAEEVFPSVGDFLERMDAPGAGIEASAPRPPHAHVPARWTMAPSLGPRLGWWRPDPQTGTALARLWFRTPFSDPDSVEVEVHVVSAEARKGTPMTRLGGLRLVPLSWGCGVVDVTLPIDAGPMVVTLTCSLAGRRHFAAPLGKTLPREGARLCGVISPTDGEVVLSDFVPPRVDPARLQLLRAMTRPRVEEAVSADDGDLAVAVAPPVATAPLDAQPPREPGSQAELVHIDTRLLSQFATGQSVEFLLGSCRYQASEMEQSMADVALSRIADGPASPLHSADFAVLVGDLIYADASYGVLDGRPSSARLRGKYEALWGGAAGAIGRRVPLYLCGDDHELRDD